VNKGELTCTKVLKGETKETFLKTYFAGEIFGELSLLYNSPRAASIKSKTKSQLFSLDRETFNHIVKNSAIQRRRKYQKFLQSVEIFKNLD